jgi:hypothetical protein
MILKDDCREQSLLVIEVWSAEMETCNMRFFPHPLKARFFCKSRFGFLGFGLFGFVKQMERIVRIGIRPLFSRHFYNKFSVPLYFSVVSMYMLEGQKLEKNVES